MPSDTEPGRRQRKRIRTLDHIADTAAALFESVGYETVTMEQIAEAADVAKRTLYNHFPTKEAVLAHWLDAELARDLVHLHAEVARRRTFVSRLGCVLDASAAWCEKHPAYLAAYLKHRFLGFATADDPGAATGSDIASAWHELIAAGQHAGELAKRFSADQLATWFHYLYLGALMRWLSVPGTSLRAEFGAITRLFVDGAGAKARAPR